MDWYHFWSGCEVIPQILHELKLLRWAQVEDRWRCWVHSNPCSQFSQIGKQHGKRAPHATVLYQLGLNQDELSYLHQGRKERLTEVHGEIITEILG